MFGGLICNTVVLEELKKLCGRRVTLILFGGGRQVGRLASVGVVHQVVIMNDDETVSTSKTVVAADAIIGFEYHTDFDENSRSVYLGE